MRIVPVELVEANAYVDALHRHHKPVVGHRFSLGAVKDGRLVGVAIVGRPVAQKTDERSILEVARVCTDGTKNACSKLYAAAARIGRIAGFHKIQTFILDTEQGVTLRAAGWEFDGMTDGGDGWQSREGRRDDQPTCPKGRWVRVLNPPPDHSWRDHLPSPAPDKQLAINFTEDAR